MLDTNITKIAQLKMLVLKGELEQSIAFAEEEIQSRPHNPLGYVLKALHYFYINEPEEALLWSEKVYGLSPENEETLTITIAFYHETELHKDRRKKLVNKALELFPDNAYFHYMYALINLNVDFDQSEKSYQEAMRLDPDMAEYPALYASMLYFLKRDKEAAKYEDMALRKQPENTAFLNRFALIAYERKKYKKARVLIEKAKQLEPDNKVIRDTYKKIYPTKNGFVRGKREINNVIQSAFAAPAVWLWRNVFNEKISIILVTFTIFLIELVGFAFLTGKYALILIGIYLVWGYFSQQMTKSILSKAGYSPAELSMLWGQTRTQSDINADTDWKLQPWLPIIELEIVLISIWDSKGLSQIPYHMIELDMTSDAPQKPVENRIAKEYKQNGFQVAASSDFPAWGREYHHWPTALMAIAVLTAVYLQFSPVIW